MVIAKPSTAIRFHCANSTARQAGRVASASNAAEACVHAEARWATLAREEHERGESLRTLVASIRQGDAP